MAIPNPDTQITEGEISRHKTFRGNNKVKMKSKGNFC